MPPPRLLSLRYFSPSWRIIQIRQASGTHGTLPKTHLSRRPHGNSHPSTEPADSVTSSENNIFSRDTGQSELPLTDSKTDLRFRKISSIPSPPKWPKERTQFYSRDPSVRPRSRTPVKNGTHEVSTKDKYWTSEHDSRKTPVPKQLNDSNEIADSDNLQKTMSIQPVNKPVITDANPEAGGSPKKTVTYRYVQIKDASQPPAQFQPIQEPPQRSDRTLSNEEPKKIPNSHNASLLEELFPEIVKQEPPTLQKPSERIVPKLDLPDRPRPIISLSTPVKIRRKQYVEGLKSRAENVTVLKLQHCSTALTEADFRRLIPQGKHIEGWVRDGDIAQVIPGRDTLSLSRLPFYLLLFSTRDAAVAYQANAARIHKLAARHTPSSPFSAVPPPPGVLEDGEDLHALIQSYTLSPPSLKLSLNMVHQPYDPVVRAVIEQGGYRPIVGNSEEKLHKVLLWIEGHESHPFTLYNSIQQDAVERGLVWGIVGGQKGIKRLADIMDITKYSQPSRKPEKQTEVPQEIMNRVYNRWIIEFETESMARRFARAWHRRRLPIAGDKNDWRDDQTARMCNTEVLW